MREHLLGRLPVWRRWRGSGKWLNQKEKRENHEFLNPIVGFRAVQAAAVAAVFSNAVMEATCRVGVRPCRPCVYVCQWKRARLTGALAITFTPRHHSLTELPQVGFIRSLFCSGVFWSAVSMCVKPFCRVWGQRGLIGQEPLTQITFY